MCQVHEKNSSSVLLFGKKHGQKRANADGVRLFRGVTAGGGGEKKHVSGLSLAASLLACAHYLDIGALLGRQALRRFGAGRFLHGEHHAGV